MSTAVNPGITVSHSFDVNGLAISPYVGLEGRGRYSLDASIGLHGEFGVGGDDGLEFVSSTVPCDDTVVVAGLSPEDRKKLEERRDEILGEMEAEERIKDHAIALAALNEFLEETAGDAKAVKERSDELQKHLGKVQEALEETKAFTKDGIDDLEAAKDAAEKIGEGVGEAAERLEKAQDAAAKMAAATKMMADLIELGDASGADQIRGLGDMLTTMTDGLGDLTNAIRGFGAFLEIWIKSITAIADSVEVTTEMMKERNALADEYNRIYKDAKIPRPYHFGRSLREQRADELNKINELLGVDDERLGESAQDNDTACPIYEQYVLVATVVGTKPCGGYAGYLEKNRAWWKETSDVMTPALNAYRKWNDVVRSYPESSTSKDKAAFKAQADAALAELEPSLKRLEEMAEELDACDTAVAAELDRMFEDGNSEGRDIHRSAKHEANTHRDSRQYVLNEARSVLVN